MWPRGALVVNGYVKGEEGIRMMYKGNVSVQEVLDVYGKIRNEN